MSATDTLDFKLDFPRALGQPAWEAGFRRQPADFRVDEALGFEPDGQGEHLLLHVAKEGQNTRWVAKLLSEAYGVPEAAVGYCGLKDRRAETRQWFSVHLPGNSPLAAPRHPDYRVLATARHGRKLRPGSHRGNHFIILLRDLADHRNSVESRLAAVADRGVPNYFGEQRFGIDGGNLHEVAKILARPRPRFRGRRGGLYLSAARSWLFNQVLAARVTENSWDQTLGDEPTPTGPLWGRGRNPAPPAVRELEERVLTPWRDWCLALEHSGLSQERRPLVLRPEQWRWRWLESDLEVGFSLQPGAYATAVLRELALLTAPPAVL